MLANANFPEATIVRRPKAKLGTNARKRRRHLALESLESRVVLSYTFSLVGQTATVSPVASTGGPFLIDEVVVAGNPLLEWSQDNGVTFSTDWDSATPGTQTLAANSSSTVDITPTTGAGSSLTLGDLSSAASNIFAHINLGPPFAAANNDLIIDDSSSTHAAGSYDFFPVLGTITGPGGAAGGINFTSFGPIHSYEILGGPLGNTFNIHSTFNFTIASTTIIGGAGNDTANVLGDTFPGIGTPLHIDLGGGTNTVNVGTGNIPAVISSTVSVTDTGGTTDLFLHDQNDTSTSTVSLGLSGIPATPHNVTGFSSGGSVLYGAGVTALNINGGTSGAAGVTYEVNSTQAGTTTTINGGPNDDTFNLSAVAHDLADLAGPVVVNGNGGTNSAVLFDQNGAGGAYAIDATTVAAPGFAGLTYGTISNLTLDSSNNPSTIDVNGTAAGVTTTVNTGSGGSTVNVLATDATGPLDIVGGGIDTVNIGSAGGPGTMANIQGAISVVNASSLTALNFHDENDTTGQTWTLNNDDGTSTGSVAVTGSATTSYVPADLSQLTVNGGSGGNTFDVNNTSAHYPTTLNTGTGDDTVNVFATGANTLDIHGQDGTDTVTLGGSTSAPLGMQGLSGTINVDNALGSTDLVLDDSQDTTGQTASLTNDGTTGTVTGLSPATINYTNAGTDSMTVDASNAGGNIFTVTGTLVNPSVPNTLTTINKGTGSDNSVTVHGTNAGSVLDLTGGVGDGTDTVELIASSPPTILGAVNVDEAPGSTNLVINLTNDGLSHDFVLYSNGTTSTLHDNEGNFLDFTYTTSALASLTIDTDPAFDQTLNIDFGGVMPGDGFNPIPTGRPAGLIFNADGDGSNLTPPAGTHALNIYGELVSGPFASETHNANDQTVFPQVGQYGSIFFTDAAAINTGLDYTGLQPINDSTPAIDYTFNDFGYPDQSFSATSSTFTDPSGTFDSIEFANTPTPPFPLNFETTDIANKNFVTFNTPPSIPPIPNNGLIGTVNIPVPSDGLLSLTFNTFTGGTDTVSFVNTPPGVVTSYFDGAGNAITNVTGLGVADGTVLFLNGGAGVNTLNYDAGGEVPTITPGLLPGEVLISIPGAGTVDAINYQAINITNLGPLVITPGPAVTINTVEGFQNVDAIVGTFTVPIPVLPSPPGGFPASDFTATIDWGDPSPDLSAGTITQDASIPSVYYITGTHTFVDNGTYTVTNTVAFSGGTFTTPVNGVPIMFSFGPAGPTPGTPATAVVTEGPLAVSAFPIVGTEGIAIAAAPIATFIDNGGADPIADYSATITVTNSAGTVVFTGPAASITQNANAAQYTVNAPAFTLPEEGTYQVVVSVTDSDGGGGGGGGGPAGLITVSGASTAVIADATLTAGAASALSATTGVALPSSTVVGSFTDANPTAPISDFTATIDWADGSPNSIGIITQPGGVGTPFDVTGGHTYAKPGTYAITIVVKDVGGSAVTLTGAAGTETVTVMDMPVTGSTNNFTATEGKDTGLFVLATFVDPNTLATVADVNAQLAVGGWGDGTPTASGINLVVQEIGVTPLTSATDPGAPIFEVLGSHTYQEETAPGTPDTLSVIITTLGGMTTTLTSPPGGGVTVLDAPLSSSNGPEITGTEGIMIPNQSPTVMGALLGSFTDANQFATVADFTTAPGSVVVTWGDGSAPETLTAGNLTMVGTANGITWNVNASHTYAEAGTYQYTVAVTDDGGSTTTFIGSAIIHDAALAAAATQPTVSSDEATTFPTPEFGGVGPTDNPGQVFNGPVANFTDANPTAPVADFTATIDWGDGTPKSAGTLSQPGGAGTVFVVSGTHTYATSGVTTGTGTFGHYPIQVFVQDVDGSRLTVTNSASVEDNSITVVAHLSPGSDSGLSTGTPNVTNVVQPVITGTVLATLPDGTTVPEPYAHVSIFATGTGGTPILVGTVQAGSDGSFSVQASSALASGTYTITATAVDQFGQTTTTGPVTVISPLVIDTTGPVIDGLFFNRLNGQVDYIIKDPVLPDGTPPSGVWVNSLLNSSNYLLTKVHAGKAYPGKWVVTNVTATPDPTIPFAYDVAVTFNGGKIIQGGFYLFTIRDSSNGNSSVQDLAENHLDGVFYGTFPSGNGVNGSDFIAELQAYHNKIFAPQSIVGSAAFSNGGVGGVSTNAVHSGVFVTALPRGASPIFSTSTSVSNGGDPPAHHKKHKGQIVIKTKQHGQSLLSTSHEKTKHTKVVIGKNHPKAIIKKK